MSGGFWNHQEYAIKVLIEELEEYVSEALTEDKPEWVAEEYREEVKEEITLVLNDLIQMYDKVKNLDYLLSGDTGVKEFLKNCRKFRKL